MHLLLLPVQVAHLTPTLPSSRDCSPPLHPSRPRPRQPRGEARHSFLCWQWAHCWRLCSGEAAVAVATGLLLITVRPWQRL